MEKVMMVAVLEGAEDHSEEDCVCQGDVTPHFNPYILGNESDDHSDEECRVVVTPNFRPYVFGTESHDQGCVDTDVDGEMVVDSDIELILESSPMPSEVEDKEEMHPVCGDL